MFGQPYKRKKKPTPLAKEALERFNKEIPQKKGDWYKSRAHTDNQDPDEHSEADTGETPDADSIEDERAEHETDATDANDDVKTRPADKLPQPRAKARTVAVSELFEEDPFEMNVPPPPEEDGGDPLPAAERIRPPGEIPERLKFAENSPKTPDDAEKPVAAEKPAAADEPELPGERKVEPWLEELRERIARDAKNDPNGKEKRRREKDFRVAHREAVKAKQVKGLTDFDSEWERSTEETPNAYDRPAPSESPLFWYIAAILIIGCLALFLFFQMSKSSDASDSQSRPDAQERPPVAKLSAGPADHVLNRFFQAKTIEDLLAVVRHPTVVEPLMRRWYSEHPLAPVEIEVQHVHERMASTGAIDAPDQLWVTDVVVKPTNSTQPIPVQIERVSDGIFKVDWECAVRFSEHALGSFLENGSSGPGTFRVSVQPDDYFNFDYSDRRKWSCYRISSESGEHTLFGYVAKGEAVEQTLQSWFYPGEQRIQVILTIQIGNRSEDMVEIVDVLQKNWLIDRD